MYYGNPSASSFQNGEKVFEFFDDFNDNNKDRWSTQTQSNDFDGTVVAWTESGGVMHIECDTGDCYFSATNENVPTDNIVLMARAKCLGTNTDGEFGITIADSTWNRPNNYQSVLIRNDSQDVWRDEGTIISFTNTCNTYYIEEIRDLAGSAADVYINGTQYGTVENDVTTSSGNVGIHVYKGDVEYDWIALRKYVATEPSVGSPGTEEKSPGPIAYWRFDEGYGTTANDMTSK